MPDDDDWVIIHVRQRTKKALRRAKGDRKIGDDCYIDEILRYDRIRKVEKKVRKGFRLFPDL